MHELLLKRNVHQRILLRSIASINTLFQNNSVSIRIIEKRLKEITDRWISLQETHDSYVISSLSDENDVKEEDEILANLESKYYATELKCERYLEKNSLKESLIPLEKPTENGIKLERFTFPKFDGHVRKYAKFKYEFNKFVKPMCTESQLPFVLKSYLCDSVRNDVQNFDSDISLMWQRLDAKFGSRQKLIDCILSEVNRLPETNDNSTILEMINVIEAAHNDLNFIGATEELNNSTILSMIEQRMTAQMNQEWIKIIINIPSSQRFTKLLEFLNGWKLRVEYRNADLRMPTEKPQGTTNERVCLIHHDCKHPIWRCRTFQSLSIVERLKIIRSSGACNLCLDIGHNAENCKRVIKCSRTGCNGKHNVLLHSDN